jgi:hypothetical protein
MNSLETMVCRHLQHEGIGSVYERVILRRWFRALAQRHNYASVLEYGCGVTKGYDNISFLDQGIRVTVADEDVDAIQESWQFPQRPAFCTLTESPEADLVWSFAQLQMDASIIDAMKGLTTKHVLVFVPNILNFGTPIHLAYHLLTRTPCRHAERGSVRLRTRRGLLRFLVEEKIEVIESGYIDAPPIPDIGFSIRELRGTMGWSQADASEDKPPTDPTRVWQRVESLTRFENSPFIAPFRPLFGHHIFALGRVV